MNVLQLRDKLRGNVPFRDISLGAVLLATLWNSYMLQSKVAYSRPQYKQEILSGVKVNLSRVVDDMVEEEFYLRYPYDKSESVWAHMDMMSVYTKGVFSNGMGLDGAYINPEIKN